MAEISSLFVTIGSKLDSAGFAKARKAVDGVAKGLAVATAALAASGLKAAQIAGVQEAAEIDLAAAMKTAGTFTEAAFQHNLDYASSLQRMTRFGDEAIIGVQKLLSNFGLQGEELDNLTEATLDLAIAQKMDLRAAGALIAKSVGSSTNALARYGVVIEGAVGSTERATSAVENISAMFGGAAKADALSYLGAIVQLKNRWGDFVESIGQNVIPVMIELFDIVNQDILPVMEEWIGSINDSGAGVEFLAKLLSNFIKVIIGIKAAFDLAGSAIAVFALTLSGKHKAAILGWEELKKKTIEYGETLEKAANLEVTVRKKAEGRKSRIIKSLTQQNMTQVEKEAAKKAEANAQTREMAIAWQEERQFMDEEYIALQDEQRTVQQEAFLADIEMRLEQTQKFTNAVTGLASSFFDFKAQAIKNELADDLNAEDIRYNQRKNFILKNVKDETERNKQLDALEKGHAASSQNLRAESERKERQFKQKMKKFQIAEAVINTAVAATKAFAQGGPFLGPVLAALVTAQGMMRIATIKAQRFAQGAFARTATPAIFGEAGPEIALPLTHPTTTMALSKALALAGGGTSGLTLNITVPPLTSRRVAKEYAKVLGNEIIKDVKRNRQV